MCEILVNYYDKNKARTSVFTSLIRLVLYTGGRNFQEQFLKNLANQDYFYAFIWSLMAELGTTMKIVPIFYKTTNSYKCTYTKEVFYYPNKLDFSFLHYYVVVEISRC